MPTEEWKVLRTQYGTVKYMFSWTSFPDYIVVTNGPHTIKRSAAAMITKYWSVEGAVEAMAKYLNA